MNTNSTLERIAAANKVPSADALPADSWSADDLLARIDERSTPVTDLKTAPTPVPDATPSRWRGPVIAGAVAAAILLVIGGIGFLANQESDIAPAEPETNTLTDPSAVIDELDRRYDEGDPRLVELYDSTVFDQNWLNTQIAYARYQWVTGFSETRDCTVEGSQVTCTYTETSGIDPRLTYETGTVIWTVEDGKVIKTEAVDYVSPVTYDEPALAAYRDWVRENHPDKFNDLFLFGQTLAIQTDELRHAAAWDVPPGCGVSHWKKPCTADS